MKELYRKHRPKRLKDFLGQPEAVKILRKKIKGEGIPHVILIHGPYGTGKTSLAYLIAKYVGCSPLDFNEQNTADYRGVDSVREIRSTVNQSPIDGNSRVWLLDEIHEATNIAQNALLKVLENPPDHAYFVLCTTDPQKLIEGIIQRCLVLRLKPISSSCMADIIMGVCKKERIKLSNDVLEKIVEYAEGSAREALQILDKVRGLTKEKEQLNAIEKASIKTQTILIARKLMDTRTKWRDIAPLLKELDGEDTEQIRYMVLGYAKSVLLKKDNARAFRMMELFLDNFYDSKFAGVVAACYQIITNG